MHINKKGNLISYVAYWKLQISLCVSLHYYTLVSHLGRLCFIKYECKRGKWTLVLCVESSIKKSINDELRNIFPSGDFKGTVTKNN